MKEVVALDNKITIHNLLHKAGGLLTLSHQIHMEFNNFKSAMQNNSLHEFPNFCHTNPVRIMVLCLKMDLDTCYSFFQFTILTATLSSTHLTSTCFISAS